MLSIYYSIISVVNEICLCINFMFVLCKFNKLFTLEMFAPMKLYMAFLSTIIMSFNLFNNCYNETTS